MTTKLSYREKEVLRLIADELTTKEIAANLFVTDHTIISHRKNLMNKLEARNTAGLIRRGYENGLLPIQNSI